MLGGALAGQGDDVGGGAQVLDDLAESSQRDGTHGEQTLARRRILTLAAAHERAYVEYWESLAAEGRGPN